MVSARVLVLVALCCAAPLEGFAQQNRLVNPDFATGYLPDWNSGGFGGNATWVGSPDHTGGVSGSVRLQPVNQAGRTLYQCIPAAPGANYEFSFWTYQASGQTCTGGFTGTYGRLAWYAAPGCPNGQEIPPYFVDTSTSASFDSWEFLSASGTYPVGTQSALIVLNSYCDSLVGAFESFVDDASVTDEVIFRDDFE